MVLLTAPTPFGERPYANDWCGQAAAASCATDWLQQTIGPVMIDDRIPDSMRIQGGTTGIALVTALQALGVPARGPFRADMPTYLKYLDSGRQSIGLHQCDGNANPVPWGTTKIAHWRRFYGLQDGTAYNMNPWTGQNEASAQANMYASDLKTFVLIDGVMPKDRGDDVAYNQAQKEGIILGFRYSAFGKWPTQDEVTSYASQILDDGSNVEAVLTALRTDFQKGELTIPDRVTALEAVRAVPAIDTASLVKAIGVKLAS